MTDEEVVRIPEIDPRPMQVTQGSPAKDIADKISKAMEGTTPGPWYPGHLCDDEHSCNCASILSDTGIMGAVATVHYDNGLPISEGGNDAPPLSEAKANQRFIALCNPDNMRVLLSALADAERERDEWRKDFDTLCKAIVGETGLSAIEEAGKLRGKIASAEAKLAEAVKVMGDCLKELDRSQRPSCAWQQSARSFIASLQAKEG